MAQISELHLRGGVWTRVGCGHATSFALALGAATGCVREVETLTSKSENGGMSSGSSSALSPDDAQSTEGASPEGSACAPTVACPEPGTRLHIQLTGELDTEQDVDVYIVDLFDAPTDAFARLGERGVVRICWMGAGNWEPWRPDAMDFPSDALGEPLAGFEQERWLDIRNPEVREILEQRFERAVSRGCQGVLATNTDAYRSNSGFDLSASDALAFHDWLVQQAHERALSLGLGGDLSQAPMLVDDYDWAFAVGCLSNDGCAGLLPFVEADKAVYTVELVEDPAQAAQTTTEVCPIATERGFSSQVKQPGLDAWNIDC